MLWAFDLLELNGEDLRDLLIECKSKLAKLPNGSRNSGLVFKSSYSLTSDNEGAEFPSPSAALLKSPCSAVAM
jgi:ATP-dependent DNA ligase